jgi:biotin carboxyl carrier protein
VVNSRPMASIDADVVKHALRVARENGFAEVEIANGEAQFKAALEPGAKVRPAPSSVSSQNDAAAPTELVIRANHVGYLKVDAEKLKIGAKVSKGDVVASIATLGLANDVESAVEGEIIEVLMSDGDPLQYGQPIAKVRP